MNFPARLQKLSRRDFIGGGCASVIFGAGERVAAQNANFPKNSIIVFVPGNGEDSGMWRTLFWRFESNGVSRNQLFAFDPTFPAARSAMGTDDTSPVPNRSSTQNEVEELAAFIKQAFEASGAQSVALVGHSRGGLAIRNYLKQYGAKQISHVILAGTPNLGLVRVPGNLMNEFNGLGPFISGLNAVPVANYAPTRFLTVRSQGSDPFYQADGRYLGLLGRPTGITPEAASLPGAENIAFDGFDHLQTALHPLAFAAMFKFLTGREPDTEIVESPALKIEGRVFDVDQEGIPVNRVPEGARVSAFVVDAATGSRLGGVLPATASGRDGRWGPVMPKSSQFLEIELATAEHGTTHLYYPPFPRSSDIVNIRPVSRKAVDAIVPGQKLAEPCFAMMRRSTAYFGPARDKFDIDGAATVAMSSGPQRAQDDSDPLPTTSLRGLWMEHGRGHATGTLNNVAVPVGLFPYREGHVSAIEFSN